MTDRKTLYHAAVRAEWDNRSAAYYEPSGYAGEGFVHLSSAEQLVGTLHKHYPGRIDLMLLSVDPDLISAELVWEDLYGSGIEFPHIYGPIDLAAVTSNGPLRCDRNDSFGWWRPGPPVVVHELPPDDPADRLARLLDQLTEAGFTGCPRPLWQRDGLQAFEYLTGVVIDDPARYTVAAIERFGALLSLAHECSQGLASPQDRDVVINHGAIRPGHIVWSADDVPVGLIDWRQASVGPRRIDLGQAGRELCGHGQPAAVTGLSESDVAQRLAALAAGYGSVSVDELSRYAEGGDQ